MYYGEFDNWEDVAGNFGIDETSNDKVVLFAAYDVDGYDGSATVVFVRNGTFYIVEGGHCSCYGLEGQWEPDEMPLEGLLRMTDEGYGVLHYFEKEFKAALRCVQELKIEGLAPRDAQTLLKLALA